MYPYYILRFLGGALFLAGIIIMIFNVWKTIRGDVAVERAYGDGPAISALKPAE